MAQALDLGADQEYSVEVGDSRSQEAHPLPKSKGPYKTGTLSRKMRWKIWRHMPGAAPSAPRLTSHIMWVKMKKLGREEVTARLQHHHLLSQLRRQATENYLINIRITKIHTAVWFTVHDAYRKIPKESRVPERKQRIRKERGKRKGSRKNDRCGVTRGQVQ